MKIPQPVRKAASDLRDRFMERYGKDLVLSDRLKTMIAAIAVILFLSSLLGLHQLVVSLERHYVRAQTDMARLQSQIRTNVWQERRQQGQILKSVLEERLWTAQTPGLADAGFEKWLRDHMGRYKMEPMQQIQIRRVPVSRTTAPAPGATPDKLSEIQRMTAKLVLPFDSQGLSNFLADVAEGEKTVVIDRLSVRAGRNARIEMDISAFYWAPGKS
ncbi:MAG: hypothetical protein K1X51_00955 [Rhodospirillaceae bacterium]|nr:hypothetical protein [Rhodospirillaceae bacterium]